MQRAERTAPRRDRPRTAHQALVEPSNHYTRERRARQAWRAVRPRRKFAEQRAEAERMRRGGWCFALAWGLAVAVMVACMALFGIGC